jgi:hypothetical protein
MVYLKDAIFFWKFQLYSLSRGKRSVWFSGFKSHNMKKKKKKKEKKKKKQF